MASRGRTATAVRSVRRRDRDGALRPASTGRPLAPALVAAGGVLRLIAFFGNQSLGLDETRLALNVASRPYLDLFPPLDHDQSAPILFLWAERAVVSLLGVNEAALRLVPLLAGLGILLLMPSVAGRLFGRPGAVLATGMAAVSTSLLDYSNEAKQYAVEALVTLVLLAMGLRWLEEPANRRRRRWLLIGGIFSIWLAGTAVFVLAGVVCAAFIKSREARAGAGRYPYLLAGTWGLAFAVAYQWVYRSVSVNTYMNHFWRPALLVPGGAGGLFPSFRAVEGVIWGFAAHPFDLPLALAAWYVPLVSVVLLGVAGFGTRDVQRSHGYPTLALCVVPVAAAVVASLLGIYPLGVRLMLYAIPIFHICLSGGIVSLVASLPAGRRPAAVVTLGMLVLLPQLRLAIFTATTDLGSAQVRQAVAELRVRRAPGEAVYVFARSIPEWSFYTTDWTRPDTARLGWLERLSRPGGAAFENAPSRRAPVGGTEGSDLVRSSAHGRERLGLPSGMEWLALERIQSGAPDAGWASREASRIQAAATPGIWLLMSTYYPPEKQLLDSVARRAARITYSKVRRNLALVRYQFASTQ